MFQRTFQRLIIDELPNVVIKTAKLFLYLDECFCILDGCCYFKFVSNDAFVGKKLGNFFCIILYNFLYVKVVKCFAIIFSLFQNCCPRKSCLCSFKDQKFKEFGIFMDRDTPFFVMIDSVQRITNPLTAFFIIHPGKYTKRKS